MQHHRLRQLYLPRPTMNEVDGIQDLARRQTKEQEKVGKITVPLPPTTSQKLGGRTLRLRLGGENRRTIPGGKPLIRQPGPLHSGGAMSSPIRSGVE